MSKRYTYKLKNVDDVEHVLDAVKKVKGVIKAEAMNGELSYTITDQTDEYDVLVAAVNSADEIGGEVIIGEEKPVSDYDYNAEYDYEDEEIGTDDGEESADNRPIEGDISEEEDSENLEEGFEEQKPIADDYDEDRIVAAKKKIRSQTITRFVELSVSMVALVVSLFLKQDATNFLSFKNILQIISFALAAYEVLYNAVIDIAKKKWYSENIYIGLSFLAAALLGLVGEITVLALVFAVGKEVETYIKDMNDLRVDDNFYTGSLPVTLVDGDKKAVKDIAAGDEIILDRYDVVPCDGEVLTDATFDAFKVEGIVEKNVKAGDKISAGAVLLSKSATVRADVTNEESKLVKRKKAFEEKLKEYEAAPSFMKFLTPVAFIASVAFVFIAAAFYSEGYASGLAFYGPIGLLIVFCTLISYLLSAINSCAKNAAIIAKMNSIGFADKKAFDRLASANSFVFDADALTENGAVKPDTFGALKELLNSGAKNVTTDFEGSSLPEEVKKKIDFVDNAFGGEKKLAVGKNKDMTLDESGDIAVGNGEISFVPLAFRLARRAKKAKTAAFVINFIAYLGAIAMAIFLNSIGFLFAAVPVVAAITITQVLALGCAKEL